MSPTSLPSRLTVIVGGDIIKRDGKLAGDNVGHALELMHAARERLRA